jgi:hypothetical protein
MVPGDLKGTGGLAVIHAPSVHLTTVVLLAEGTK